MTFVHCISNLQRASLLFCDKMKYTCVKACYLNDDPARYVSIDMFPPKETGVFLAGRRMELRVLRGRQFLFAIIILYSLLHYTLNKIQSLES